MKTMKQPVKTLKRRNVCLMKSTKSIFLGNCIYLEIQLDFQLGFILNVVNVTS